MHVSRTHSARQLFATTVALLALLVGAPGAAAADEPVGFAVAPMIFDVDVKPGQSSTFQITISNSDSVATRYTFSKEDYEGDKDEPAATPVLLGGKFPSAISGHDWITAPGPVTVPAGQQRTVPVKVTAPAGATGGHYAALMVHGGTRTGGNITATSRIGVLFLMNAGGAPPPDIKITEIREAGPTRTVTKIVYETSTTTPIKPKPQVIVRDPLTGKPLRRVPAECTTSVPSASGGGGIGTCTADEDDARLVGDGGGVTSGAEQTYVELFPDQHGEGTSAKGALPTEWAGAWSSMLLPLIGIALFVLYFLFLRRRRKDQDEGDGEAALDLPVT